MKGVIMRADSQKSIVLFNNGKFGTIPTPPNGEAGMVVSVSYNKKAIVLLAALCCAVLAGAALTGGFLYFTPIGYIQVRYGNTAGTAALVELAYNRFLRVLEARPLNARAVNPLADISIRHSAISAGYGELIKTFIRSPAFRGYNTARVRIAQDDLAQAKAIERDLSRRSEPLMTATGRRLSVTFDLYTLELYRTAVDEDTPNSPLMRGSGHQHMMMNMRCNR